MHRVSMGRQRRSTIVGSGGKVPVSKNVETMSDVNATIEKRSKAKINDDKDTVAVCNLRIASILASGHLFNVENLTKAKVVGLNGDTAEVQITDGDHAGKKGFLSRGYLVLSP